VALVRPGPAESGMKEAYCRRQRGLERATFHHPRLEPVLGGTHGVMLYEEDVMRVASALSGISLAEGDDLRRAIGAARGDEEFRSLERGFVMHARRAGVSEAVARAAWRDLTRFAAYGFCKAHAAGYGTLGYQSAYLKAHFPTEWAVGILNHHAGMYSTWVHVEDLRRHGVEFRAPCVQRSAWDSTLELEARGPSVPSEAQDASVARGTLGSAVPAPPHSCSAGSANPWLSPASARPLRALASCAASAAFPGPRASRAVRVGLSRVQGLHERTGERIVSARARAAFAGLADFIARVRPAIHELEALILGGAFDWTRRTRPSLLLEARVSVRGPARGGIHATGARAPVVAATAWDRAGARNGAAGSPRPAARQADAQPAPLLATADGVALEAPAVPPVETPSLPEFALRDRVIGECRATGLWFSGHPLDVLVGAEARRGAVPAASVPERAGRRVSVAGLPCAYRRVETKSGGQMLFMTLADESGLVECTFFPEAYRRLAGAIRGQVVRVSGRVEQALDAVSVTVERADALA
jgi:DNA polymerase III alpha subunit